MLCEWQFGFLHFSVLEFYHWQQSNQLHTIDLNTVWASKNKEMAIMLKFADCGYHGCGGVSTIGTKRFI